ncbi:MAG: VOC family protein [Kiritimatiellae bacterium]|nr:VOC family protein [Kiritimatiellia bacterium]
MQALKCDHVHLIAADVEATVAWYCRVLDAQVTFQGIFRGSPVRYLSLGGMAFVVFGRLEGDAVPRPGTVQPKCGVDHFGFAVDDLTETLAELTRRGAKLLEGPVTVRPGLRIAYIEGPDSIRIELCERRAPTVTPAKP